MSTLRQIGKTRNQSNFEKVEEGLQAAALQAVAILHAALFDDSPSTQLRRKAIRRTDRNLQNKAILEWRSEPSPSQSSPSESGARLARWHPACISDGGCWSD